MKRPTLKEKVPEYLHQFIAEQDPSLYTAIDHASWRYIMRVSRRFFSEHAHQKYLDGLRETGISVERIPLIAEMDERLQQFGWRAVPIVGFIPPAAFMEFLSLGMLPIACDMRRIEHIAYTPAPDIVHEAAGHAPIIADPEYADYLLQYGEIARKVIFSDQDMNVYEAIRNLSDMKEDPQSTPKEIESAQKRLDEAVAAVDYVSEATELARMSWWTIEYGLVGSLKEPKIYGAGLLSSVSESYHCFSDDVKKVPFSIDCVKQGYDITKPQPQLYVTPDFNTLTKALDELANTMAFRSGGVSALSKALRAKTVATVMLDSGLQVSGVLAEVLKDKNETPCFLKFKGPVQLAIHDQEIEGQGPAYHKEGFSTPLGKIKKLGKSSAEITHAELERLGGTIEFESGIVVQGEFVQAIRNDGRNIMLVFNQCTVKWANKVLFDPSWGTFDMGCGEHVVSVFGGAADRGKYLAATGGFKQRPGDPKTNLTPENKELNELYAQVRKVRESKSVDMKTLEHVHQLLEMKYPYDWLLRLELLEFKGPWEDIVRKRLEAIASTNTDQRELIERGLKAL